MRERTSEAVIRRMTLEDLPEVLQIDRLSFPLPWSERSYRFELTENPASHMLVAVSHDEGTPRVVGYAGAWMLGDEAHISTLGIHPEYRRRGRRGERRRGQERRRHAHPGGARLQSGGRQPLSQVWVPDRRAEGEILP